MSAWAKVGVKCVCVDDAPDTGRGHEPMNGYPAKGEIYTIAAIGRFHPFCDADLFQLVELTNPAQADGRDCGWSPDRFRPLTSQSDDIALIKSLLLTVPALHERVVPSELPLVPAPVDAPISSGLPAKAS